MANLFTQQNFDTDVSSMESNGAFGSFLPCSFVRDTVVVHSGTGSCKVTWPAPSGSTASWINHFAVGGLTVGRRYRIQAWMYVPAGMPDISLYVAFAFGPAPVGQRFTTKNAWGLYSIDFVATATNHFFGWGTVGPPVAGVGMWLDDISLDLVPAITGQIGDASGITDPEIPTMLVGPSENLFHQIDFEHDKDFIESNLSLNTKVIATNVVRDDTRAHSGTWSLKVGWPAPDGTKPSWVNHYATDYRGWYSGLTAGRRYRFRAWVWVPSGAPDVRADVLFNSLSATCTTKDAWARIDHEFVATGPGHFIGVATAGPSVLYPDAMWTDDWRLETVQPVTGQVVDAELPAPVVADGWLGRMLVRMVYTALGWVNRHRVKWPGS